MSVMVKIASALFPMLLLAGCQSSSNALDPLDAASSEAPLKPGETRISLRGLDPEKWTKDAANSTGTSSIYACRALACSASTIVEYMRVKSPTSKPDPEAMRKLGVAKVERARRGSDGAGNVGDYRNTAASSHVGKFQNYLAVYFDKDGIKGNKLRFERSLTVVAGGVLFEIVALSEDKNAASRAMQEFMDKIIVRYNPAN